MRTISVCLSVLGMGLAVVGCSGTDTGTGPAGGGENGVGGSSEIVANGGSPSNNTGGMPGTGGARTGGAAATAGSSAINTGGKAATGGAATGGKAATGGAATGGKAATGGAATGGAATGGTKATGGATSASTGPNCSGPALSGGATYTTDGSANVAGGYNYELWHDGGGTMKMTVYGVGAAFKADWNNAGDFLARVGLKWDSTKTYDKYGTITADYAFTKSGTGGGYSFIGIYGWSKNPLIEYYIVEDWFGTGGPPTGGGTLQGTFDVDGGTYKIYKFQRVSKPSIEGSSSTFWQFFSVRQTARQCGHISITAHFDKWKSLNLTLGNMYEAKILVEAGGGVGTFDLTSATVTAK